MAIAIAPEFKNIEKFVEYLIDDERETFRPWEAQKVAESIKKPLAFVIEQLKSYGLKVELPNRQAAVRGINSNSHDRFTAKNGFVGGTGIGGASRQMVSRWQPT